MRGTYRLDDQQVKDRTDITIKMANVANESAEIVSDQLTAVWNNFYNGTQTLEHYADAMVALGAATASSSDEIAGGLEKFSSIADMIGLSFDYAAAALATITATTRQSEDVVGTALRTIFARIQGLKLGETLDDDTDLNKYSTALQAVGISIFDTNGELKDMDNILDELGDKWENLSKAQQVALAQTVAGVRQYNQLVSLMDNWSYFKENLAVAQNSDGELNRQAEIYAESWEAARNRVRAAAEELYSSLINDEAFIKITNGIGKIIEAVSTLTQGIGGLSTILPGVILLFNKMFGSRITMGIGNLAETLMYNSPKAEQQRARMKTDTAKIVSEMPSVGTKADRLSLSYTQKQVELEDQILKKRKLLSEEQFQALQHQRESLKAGQNYVITLQEQADLIKQQLDTEKLRRTLQNTDNSVKQTIIDFNKEYSDEETGKKNLFKNLYTENKNGTTTLNIENMTLASVLGKEIIADLPKTKLQNSTKYAADIFETAASMTYKRQNVYSAYTRLQQNEQYKGMTFKNPEYKQAVQDIFKQFKVVMPNNLNKAEMEKFNRVTQQMNNEVELLIKILERNYGISTTDSRNRQIALHNDIDINNTIPEASEKVSKLTKEIEENIQKANNKTINWSNTILNAANNMMTLSMIISSITNLKTIWDNDSISNVEKLTQTIMSLSMAVGMLIPLMKSLKMGSTWAFVSSLFINLKSLNKINLSNIIKGVDLASNAFGMLGKSIFRVVAPIALVTTAFLAMKKLLDALGVTQKGAQEKIQKATEKYEEQRNNLEKLNSQIEETKNKIEELNNQDTLTLVEQEELKKLEKENQLLSQQQKIQENITKQAEKDKNISILQNYSNAYKKLIKDKPKISYDGNSFTNWAEYEKYIKSKNINIDLNDSYKEWNNQLLEFTSKYKDELIQAEQEASDVMLAIISDPALYDAYEDQIQNMLNNLSEMRHNMYTDEDYIRNIIQPLFADKDIEDELNNIIKSITNNEDLTQLPEQLSNDFKIALGEVGISVDELINFTQTKINNKEEEFINKFGEDGQEVLYNLTGQDWSILLTLNLDNFSDLQDVLNTIENKKIEIFDDTQLSTAKELMEELKNKKSPLKSAYDKYQSNGGYLTAEEAYDLIAEDGAYASYLYKGQDGNYIFNKAGEDRILALEKGQELIVDEILDQRNQIISEVHDNIIEQLQNTNDKIQKNLSTTESNQNDEEILEIMHSLGITHTETFKVPFYLKPKNDGTFDFEKTTEKTEEVQATLKDAQSYYNNEFKDQVDNIQLFMNKLQELNNQFINGEVNINDYFSTLDQNILNTDFSVLSDEIFGTTTLAKQLSEELFSISSIVNSLLQQASTDFQTGKINAAEYYSTLVSGAETEYNLLVKTAKFNKVEESGTVKYNDKGKQARQDIEDENYAAAAKEQTQIRHAQATLQDAKAIQILADAYQDLGDTYSEIYQKNHYWSFSLLSEEEFNNAKTNMATAWMEAYKGATDATKAQMRQDLAEITGKITNDVEKMGSQIKGLSSEDADQLGEKIKGIIGTKAQAISQLIINIIEALKTYINGQKITLTWDVDTDNKQVTITPSVDDVDMRHGSVTDKLQKSLNEAFKNLWNEDASWFTGKNGNGIIPATTGNGNGSGSDDTPDHKDPKEFDDKYRDINNELERTTQLLDAIEKKEDKAFGRDKLKYYAEQIDQLNNKYSNYNELAYQANIYRQRGIENLKSVGIDLKVQDNGVADDELEYWQHKILDDYNAVVAKYNSLNSKSAQEAMQDEMDAAEELYNKRKKYLDEFDSDTKQYYEAQQNKIDTLAEIWEVKLKEVKNEVETLLDIQEFNKVTREIGKKIIESYNDVITQMSKANQTFFKDTAGMTLDELNGASYKEVTNIIKNIRTEYSQLQDMLAEKQQWDGVKNTKELAEAIKEAQDNLNSSLDTILEYEDYMENKLANAVDAARERFNAFINQLDHNDMVLNSIKDLMTMQGETYKTQKGFNDLQNVASSRMNTALTNAKLQQQVNEKAKQALEEAQRNLDVLKNPDGTYNELDPAYDMLKKNRDALLEEYNQTQEDLLTAAKNAMDAAEEMYTNAIERASYKFEQAITSGMGFDLLQEKYDNLIDKEERYFDKVNERYNADAYYNKVQKAIDETTDTVAADRLKRLQTELDMRKRNNQLNQYDLDILEAKYNLTIAQNALEEAQNAKDSVRLVRNSAGNWDYQFTANQDDIDAAQDDYNKALNDWYNIAKDQTKDIMDEILKLKQDTHDQLEEIYKDDTLNEQEKNAKIEELRKASLDKLEYLQREYNIAMDDMNEAGKLTITDYSNTYQENIDLIDESTKNFEEAFNAACEEMKNAFSDYNSTLKDLAEDTGTDLSNLRTVLDEVADSTKKVGDAGTVMSNQVWDSISAILAQSDAFKELLVEIQRIKAEISKDAQNMNNTYNNQSGAHKDLSEFDLADMGVYAVAQGYTNFAKDIASARAYKLNDGTTADDILNKWLAEKASGQLKQSNLSEGKFSELYVQLKDLMGFSTGGYTENGGIAVLHDKELVLNQDDTANMLSAIKILDSLAPNLAKILDNRANIGASMMATKANISSSVSAIVDKDTVPIVQQVQIQADFPGVTSALEIEMALNNIINDATQYTE